MVRFHFSHRHPLVFIEEHSLESEKVNCSGCGEPVSGPSFGCMQCKFYLDKQCAKAPFEMRHPFHRRHSFYLVIWEPSDGRWLCDFCGKTCENFFYHCGPCNLSLHIKCALFSHSIAEKRIAELQHISRVDPSSIDTGNCTKELKKAECFVCGKPLLDFVYLSPDCGFYLHAKCLDLPPKINLLFHQKHPFLLQFNSQTRSCNICQKLQFPGLVYRCSPCNLTLHIKCAENTNTLPTKINKRYHRKHPLLLQPVKESLPCQICQETTNFNDVVYFCSICKFVLHIRCVPAPPIIEDRLHHEHPFFLLQRQVSLSCDVCGTSGNYVPYVCSTCHLVVHKKCISLPRTIKFSGHQHNLSHTYFLEQHDQSKTWECRVCCEEVDAEHGSYFCSKCDYIVHVNCATKYRWLYREVESIEEDETPESDEPTDAREIVTATWIKHSGHPHNLALSEDSNWEFKQCDGCLLPVSTSCYHCLQCDFFLHKSCAELPLKKHVWFHNHQEPLRLTLEGIFICAVCGCQTSGFVYTCAACEDCVCLRCTLVPDITRCEGHEHNLYWRSGSGGWCNACGGRARSGYRCRSCDFVLHHKCIILPVAARHRFDEHPFKLTYHDADDYSESHRCDICEKERNPEHWFYHCSDCNSSAHTECVLGEYSFIKPGTIYTKGDHPHPLTFVRKDHIYPKCRRCGEYCIDLSLECNTTGCSYIVHWGCVIPPELQWPPGLWWFSQSEKKRITI